MTRRSIAWYPSAIDDLDAIVERLRARGSHVNAEKVLAKIARKVGSLRISANRDPIVPEFLAHGIARYRELSVPPWRIIYRVEPKEVVVLTIVDSRRQLDELLLERLVRAD